MEFPPRYPRTGEIVFMEMLGIAAIAFFILGVASITMLLIGIAIYIANTIWLLSIYKDDPTLQHFDFTGYYTDTETHLSLLLISIPVYIVIRIFEVKRWKKIGQDYIREQI